MIAKEKDVGEQPLVYFKYLDLLTPKVAQRFGIKTEVPVFVSPLVKNKFLCTVCDSRIGPLVYRTEYKVEAHHFHHDSASGIYFYDETCERPAKTTNWLVMILPQEDELIKDESLFKKRTLRLRARSAFVGETKAFCCLYNHGEKLSEGLVMEHFDQPGLLVPLCGDLDTAFDVEDEWSPRFRFQITAKGEVLFSNLPNH